MSLILRGETLAAASALGVAETLTDLVVFESSQAVVSGVVGVQSVTGTGTNTPQGAPPPGTQVGDLVYALMAHTSSNGSVTAAPAGWTQEGYLLPADHRLGLWSKVMVAADLPAPAGTGTGVAQWTINSTQGWSVDMVTVRGWTKDVQNSGVAAAATTRNTPSVTPTGADRVVLHFLSVDRTGPVAVDFTHTFTGELLEVTNNATMARLIGFEQITGGSGVAYSEAVRTSASLATAAFSVAGAFAKVPVTASRSTSWNVAAGTGTTPVTATRSTSWNVKAPVAATRATTWDTLAATTSTRATTWNARAATTSTRATSWRVLAVTTSTRATTWDTLTGTTATRGTTWDTLAAATSTRTTTWRVRAAVTASRATTWNVASSMVSVTSSRATTWRTRSAVTGTRTTTWDTLAAINRALAASWDVRTATTATRATTWNVAPANLTATATRTAAWRTLAPVTTARTTTWDVRSDLAPPQLTASSARPARFLAGAAAAHIGPSVRTAGQPQPPIHTSGATT